jgi:hypothetical protein
MAASAGASRLLFAGAGLMSGLLAREVAEHKWSIADEIVDVRMR